ncbi:DUF4837 family protein [Nitritalea halalkaliphila]|uniref:DUF4837 family protein n=1 Tax=Nitritalea halalkaliphila TaxID=590849 RepID=UPI0006821FE8
MHLILLIAFFSVFATCFFWSCAGDKEGKEGSIFENKPKARGQIGEIILAIDSAKWAGPVGDQLKKIFQEEVPGLIRPEPMFSVKRVEPKAMTRILRMATNLVFVTTFDDKKPGSQSINAQFAQNLKDKAAEDRNFHMYRANDEFAKGQEVIYFFGNNEEELVANLENNRARIQNIFRVREKERLEKLILNRKSGDARAGGEPLGLNLNLPASYQIAKAESDFLWLRQPTPNTNRADISLFYHVQNYVSEEQLKPENIMRMRNNITRQHIFGDPSNRDSFLTLEYEYPEPTFFYTQVAGNYAIEMRGGWKTNTNSMGGSMLGIAFVDQENNKLYYMEGFVYYPNEKHREAIREIETLLTGTTLLRAAAE